MEVNSGKLKTKPVSSKVEGLKRGPSYFVKIFFYSSFSFIFFSFHIFFWIYQNTINVPLKHFNSNLFY